MKSKPSRIAGRRGVTRRTNHLRHRRSTATWLATSWLLTVTALALGCRKDADAPRLVLLYAPCSVNASYLSPYDESVPFTPFLDDFADESMVFERHQTEAGQSAIAYASLFSGSQADRHGAFFGPAELGEDLYLIGEAYRDAGYETFYWYFHGLARPDQGYAQGVDADRAFSLPLLDFDPRFLEILDRLASEPDYRAFVMTTFTVTHGPYNAKPLDAFLDAYGGSGHGLPPDERRRLAKLHRDEYFALTWNFRAAVERLQLSEQEVAGLIEVTEQMYAANVHRLDESFGKIVEAIRSRDLLDQSLVAFTADHGEVLYRDNALFPWGHSLQLAPEVLRVPWIVRAPGVRAGRYEGVTRSMDVLPTLLGLSGVDHPDGAALSGVDLSDAIRGRAPAPDLIAASHTSTLPPTAHEQMLAQEDGGDWAQVQSVFPNQDPSLMWAMLRKADVIYRLRGRAGRDWRTEAFDLARDPEARRDMFDASDPEHAAMARELDVYKRHLVERFLEIRSRQGAPAPPDEETREKLRALGYIQ